VKNGLQQKLPRLVLLNQILHLIRPDNRQCVRCKVEIENFVALDETQVRFGNGSSRKADKFHGDPPLQNKIRVDRITLSGAGWPVHSVKASAPWCKSIDSPLTARRP